MKARSYLLFSHDTLECGFVHYVCSLVGGVDRVSLRFDLTMVCVKCRAMCAVHLWRQDLDPVDGRSGDSDPATIEPGEKYLMEEQASTPTTNV